MIGLGRRGSYVRLLAAILLALLVYPILTHWFGPVRWLADNDASVDRWNTLNEIRPSPIRFSAELEMKMNWPEKDRPRNWPPSPR